MTQKARADSAEMRAETFEVEMEKVKTAQARTTKENLIAMDQINDKNRLISTLETKIETLREEAALLESELDARQVELQQMKDKMAAMSPVKKSESSSDKPTSSSDETIFKRQQREALEMKERLEQAQLTITALNNKFNL